MVGMILLENLPQILESARYMARSLNTHKSYVGEFHLTECLAFIIILGKLNHGK